MNNSGNDSANAARSKMLLTALPALAALSLDGVIVGKALYEGRFTVAEAQAVLDGAEPGPGAG